MNRLSECFARNKKDLYFALIATFLWGILAHGYCFFDNSVSHDSLNEFHAAIFGNDWKIQLGRVFTPLYRDIFRGDATLPWLIGVLSLFWLGLAVFLVIRIFGIDSKVMMVLTAGIFAVNTSVSATAATYLNDLDSNMFAVLCAVAAVYCWKYISWGELPGAVLIMGSLGIYQGYLTVTIVLVMFVCILALFRGNTFQEVFRKGLRAIGMILLGGVLYYAAMKIITQLTGNALTTGDNNSLGNILKLTPQMIPDLVARTYENWFQRLWMAYSAYPAVAVKGITILMFLSAALAVTVWMCNKKIGIWEKLLGIVLILLLPLGMNIYFILALGNIHDLMVYAIWLCYLLVLLLADWLVKQWQASPKKEKTARLIRMLCFLLVFLTVYGSVQFANGMYLKKDLEYDAYLSLMTRIVTRMEDYDDYVIGETPVVFVGLPKTLHSVTPGFKEYWNVIGMQFTDVILQPSPDRFQAYFNYVLNVPVNLADSSTWTAMRNSDRVKQMPAYPADGFLAMEDGVLIVKLG